MSSEYALGKVLEYEMQKQGISLQTLAKQLNISEGTLRSYISGKTAPRVTAIASMCIVLKISADYLLGKKDEYGNKI
ncbi:MAG: helix-turn-helix transcriptional regulator [Clostridia bacterium]|jgi:transcriptional regulator with XRE-family HTH domain|nr:helix-turn-helix transcriptional regulator [Clostridia bacterium]